MKRKKRKYTKRKVSALKIIEPVKQVVDSSKANLIKAVKDYVEYKIIASTFPNDPERIKVLDGKFKVLKETVESMSK